MTRDRMIWLCFVGAAVLSAALTGCDAAHLHLGPAPVPSSSPTSGPTPGVCATQNPNTSGNLVVVAMSNVISPTTAPTYGPVGGYVAVNLNTRNFKPLAAVINSYVNAAGKTVPITSKNVLQFANVETVYAVVNHSAVGFTGEHFPERPYTFPSAAPKPTASAISATSFWSTGRIANAPSSSSSGDCFSQVFTLKPGVYYFGDYDYYNVSTTTFRDVLVVGTPTPPAR